MKPNQNSLLFTKIYNHTILNQIKRLMVYAISKFIVTCTIYTLFKRPKSETALVFPNPNRLVNSPNFFPKIESIAKKLPPHRKSPHFIGDETLNATK